MSLNDFSTHSFFPMENKIQNYAWGSTSSIHDLFGFENESQQPQAEVWMGTHPKGCSIVTLNQHSLLLSELINSNKPAFLSTATANEFGDLPFLFKILAADKALSIQVHPNKTQAEKGFNKEEQAGISLNAEHRNYKDENHKPELVYALTEYQAMNGFRHYTDIVNAFQQLNIPELIELVEGLSQSMNPTGLEHFFSGLLTMNKQRKHNAIDHLLCYAKLHADQGVFQLIHQLSEQYPNDIGLFSPLILNVITLAPGEAMYLSANTPHAYLKGTGLEIMANSDNVLRAGLTPKHIDVDELIACTVFNPTPFSDLKLSAQHRGGCDYYDIPVNDFNFSIIHAPNQIEINTAAAEIVMAIESDLTLTNPSGETLRLAKGQSAFIPAYINKYLLSSNGRVARAFS